jgi:hypothetical protein
MWDAPKFNSLRWDPDVRESTEVPCSKMGSLAVKFPKVQFPEVGSLAVEFPKVGSQVPQGRGQDGEGEAADDAIGGSWWARDRPRTWLHVSPLTCTVNQVRLVLFVQEDAGNDADPTPPWLGSLGLGRPQPTGTIHAQR